MAVPCNPTTIPTHTNQTITKTNPGEHSREPKPFPTQTQNPNRTSFPQTRIHGYRPSTGT